MAQVQATAESLDWEPRAGAWTRLTRFCRRHPTVTGGAVVVLAMGAVALMAPHFTLDPLYIDPLQRLQPPAPGHWFGTDNLGRDIFSRTVNGGRISLAVGFSVALLATLLGLLVGLVSGFSRAVDNVVMRVMDGLMAIPDVLLAIALVAVTGASIENVIVAISIPQVPLVARLVRSIVLSIREEPYVEAAISVGSRTAKILYRHILPNAMAPLLVQATYVCASAMITEALLGFIGAGVPPDVPSWGNVMAQGRMYFQIAPWIIFFPGVFLTMTVLAVNIMGDGLRDMLDPRLASQMK
jgi:peptide/nickel transport system permease protein